MICARCGEKCVVNTGYRLNKTVLRYNVTCLLLRLRSLLNKLENGDVNTSELIKNLSYAAQVLETTYVDETRLVSVHHE